MLKSKLVVDGTQVYTDVHLRASESAGIDSPGNSKRGILVRLESEDWLVVYKRKI